ncbi:hypothetical protein GWI33_015968 [Rhynchophorus ferrugineus]|uniref:Odorant receptor n=1 Tax=Rhynchophorus ferrugineus TaxID=354439 RepID=A0A834M7L0_RHYFE|nr:hypothetical protein GWI33_015968 [Rhynchophorus ferrugineus]
MSFYEIGLLGCVFLYSFIPILEHKSLPSDFPFFNEGLFHYPFYIFEVSAISISAFINMSLDLLALGIIYIAAIQLSILNKKLQDIDKNIKRRSQSCNDVENLTLIYLNNCCQHYVDIEKYIYLTTELLSIHIFANIGGYVIALFNSALQLMELTPFSLQALGIFTYAVMVLFQSAAYCWFGNEVYIESMEINNSCYNSEWYNHGQDVRRTMLILTERAKKPFEIKGCRYVVLSFDTLIANANHRNVNIITYEQGTNVLNGISLPLKMM